ncbi:hypothetical protein NGRA_3495, partial [Nosema granulosis]
VLKGFIYIDSAEFSRKHETKSEQSTVGKFNFDYKILVKCISDILNNINTIFELDLKKEEVIFDVSDNLKNDKNFEQIERKIAGVTFKKLDHIHKPNIFLLSFKYWNKYDDKKSCFFYYYLRTVTKDFISTLEKPVCIKTFLNHLIYEIQNLKVEKREMRSLILTIILSFNTKEEEQKELLKFLVCESLIFLNFTNSQRDEEYFCSEDMFYILSKIFHRFFYGNKNDRSNHSFNSANKLKTKTDKQVKICDLKQYPFRTSDLLIFRIIGLNNYVHQILKGFFESKGLRIIKDKSIS